MVCTAEPLDLAVRVLCCGSASYTDPAPDLTRDPHRQLRLAVPTRVATYVWRLRRLKTTGSPSPTRLFRTRSNNPSSTKLK